MQPDLWGRSVQGHFEAPYYWDIFYLSRPRTVLKNSARIYQEQSQRCVWNSYLTSKRSIQGLGLISFPTLSACSREYKTKL